MNISLRCIDFHEFLSSPPPLLDFYESFPSPFCSIPFSTSLSSLSSIIIRLPPFSPSPPPWINCSSRKTIKFLFILFFKNQQAIEIPFFCLLLSFFSLSIGVNCNSANNIRRSVGDWYFSCVFVEHFSLLL